MARLAGGRETGRRMHRIVRTVIVGFMARIAECRRPRILGRVTLVARCRRVHSSQRESGRGVVIRRRNPDCCRMARGAGMAEIRQGMIRIG